MGDHPGRRYVLYAGQYGRRPNPVNRNNRHDSATMTDVMGRGSSGLGAATVVLYLAVSLGIRRAITQVRANGLQPGHGAVV